MRRLALVLAFLAGLSLNLEAQVPDSIQTALNRAVPGLVSVKGKLLMQRDHVFDVDTVTTYQYAPPQMYSRWWDEVQACSGLSGNLEGWSWIAVPGDGFLVKGNGPFPGYAAVEDNNILVLVKYVWNDQLVKHEMLHALIWIARKEIGHPAEFDTCGLQAQ